MKAHFLIGSVTEKVIKAAPCPVMVIRPKIHGLIKNINLGAGAGDTNDFRPNMRYQQ